MAGATAAAATRTAAAAKCLIVMRSGVNPEARAESTGVLGLGAWVLGLGSVWVLVLGPWVLCSPQALGLSSPQAIKPSRPKTQDLRPKTSLERVRPDVEGAGETLDITAAPQGQLVEREVAELECHGRGGESAP